MDQKFRIVCSITQSARIPQKIFSIQNTPVSFKISQYGYLEKGALEVPRAATTKPKQIRRSVFFSPGPQWTNSSLQTGLRSNGCSVVEKMRFSDGGG